MISRTNPAVGYLDEEVFTSNAFTHTIRTGNTLYLSGIAPLEGGFKHLEVVGPGDLRAQVEWVLEVMEHCLAAEGAISRNLVAQTVCTKEQGSWHSSTCIRIPTSVFMTGPRA